MKYLTILLFFSIFLVGCEEDFSPIGKLINDYEVFCLLDTRSDKHFVLVQKLYQDETTKENLNGINVHLSEFAGKTLSLKDTIMPGLENFSVFYLHNYKLKRGMIYRLTVENDSLPTKWSDVYTEPVPSTSNFYVTKGAEAETDEYGNLISTFIYYTIHLPISPSRACGIKMFVEYYTYFDSTLRSIEIPRKFDERDNPVYPSIGYKDWDSCYTVESSYLTSTFIYQNILWALDRKVVGSLQYIYTKRLYAVYYTLSLDLYLSFIKSGDEKYSVRLDEPFFFTNFKSDVGEGYGYLGSITADTISFK
jgi:hypothetical protein